MRVQRYLCLLLVVLAVGCRRRAQECSAFVAVANREQERVAAVMSRLPSNPPEEAPLREAATAFELARTRVQSVPLTDAQLRGLSQRFSTNIEAFSTTLRGMAARVHTDDREGYNELLPALQRHNAQLTMIIEMVNEHCQQ